MANVSEEDINHIGLLQIYSSVVGPISYERFVMLWQKGKYMIHVLDRMPTDEEFSKMPVRRFNPS